LYSLLFQTPQSEDFAHPIVQSSLWKSEEFVFSILHWFLPFRIGLICYPEAKEYRTFRPEPLLAISNKMDHKNNQATIVALSFSFI